MIPAAMAPAAITAGASLLGGLLSNRSARKQAQANINAQREFAQMGVQWKVADAKKAGIHPLYALGAQTHSFQPVAINDSMGPALANAGQDIGRAIHATQTDRDRRESEMQALIAQQSAASDARLAAARSEQRADLKLASELKNDEVQRAYYAAQIAKLNAAPNPPFPGGPASPAAGLSRGPGPAAGRPGLIQTKPSESISASRGHPGVEAATTPFFKDYVIGEGLTLPLPGSQASEALEGMGFPINILATGGAYLGRYGQEAARMLEEYRAWLRKRQHQGPPAWLSIPGGYR